jgi:hypothetical protein
LFGRFSGGSTGKYPAGQQRYAQDPERGELNYTQDCRRAISGVWPGFHQVEIIPAPRRVNAKAAQQHGPTAMRLQFS